MNKNINIRISDEIYDTVEYIKITYPGGISAWIRDRLDEVQVDYDILNTVRNAQMKFMKK